jgi:hypothetical protein
MGRGSEIHWVPTPSFMISRPLAKRQDILLHVMKVKLGDGKWFARGTASNWQRQDLKPAL